MNFKTMLDFMAEAGKLKYVKRSGWWMIGVAKEETVAEHCYRCAVIGYLLAKKENADIHKVLLMTLFNDIHEARISDSHKMAHKYLNVREAEKKAYEEQIKDLDSDIKQEMSSLRKEHDAQESLESKVARDADILECLLQAKEYLDMGYPNAEKFFKKAPKHLETKTAISLWEEMQNWDSNSWWENISEFSR